MLTRLELRFFKCFELLRLPLAPLTLLTGLNASGKSSVLQALVLLHQTMREREWSTRLALNGAAVRLGAMPDVVDEVTGRDTFQIALVDGDEDICGWAFRGDRRDMSLDVLRVSVNGLTRERPSELHYLLPLDVNECVKSMAGRLRDLTYITAERLPPQETYVLEDPHVVSAVGPRGEHAVSTLHWGRDEPVLDDLALPGAPINRLRQVEERMRTLFPGFAIDLQQPPRANAVTLRLRTSDATGFHSPIHTGFGLTQILPIVVAAMSASKGGIILIENPEVHLHPAGQALMGQLMADIAHAGIQIVVETHSDHVLNGVRRAVKAGRLTADQVAIHFFRPRYDDLTQVLSPVLDNSGNIDEWPEGFFDQFDRDANYFAGWADD
ncbi:MAG: DUF3696 domain-containing protein [Chloroflexi bacterium]|nr:DUF3696 domain-containing protein [Chloroflexota bacterium]MCY3939201.1 DUF3696 domain-containing protein [Chloroflexota bacterium]